MLFGIRPKAESQLACIVIGVGASCCQVFILLHDSDSNCWVVRGAWVMRVQLCKISLTESLMEIMTVAWSRGLTNARLRATLFFHDVNPNQRVDRFVSDVRPDTHAHCASGPTRLASFAFLYLLPREHSFAMQKVACGRTNHTIVIVRFFHNFIFTCFPQNYRDIALHFGKGVPCALI